MKICGPSSTINLTVVFLSHVSGFLFFLFFFQRKRQEIGLKLVPNRMGIGGGVEIKMQLLFYLQRI